LVEEFEDFEELTKPVFESRVKRAVIEGGSRLQAHVPLLQHIENSEEYLAHEPLLEIVRELDAICESEGIVGVHYTRAIREQISSQGLLTRSDEERRNEFLETHGHRFTQAQRQRLIAGWASYFDEKQNGIRDGRVWFNLTRRAMSNGGAEPLLSHYGGEVVYMPFSSFATRQNLAKDAQVEGAVG
jgi:hypothetical protein